jgi:hypothetical protein
MTRMTFIFLKDSTHFALPFWEKAQFFNLLVSSAAFSQSLLAVGGKLKLNIAEATHAAAICAMREAEPQRHSFQLFRFIHHHHTANGIISFLPIYAQKVFCVFRSRGESKKFGKTFLCLIGCMIGGNGLFQWQVLWWTGVLLQKRIFCFQARAR